MTKPDQEKPAVSLSSVNKWYGQFHVLRDINLTVAKGERIEIGRAHV